MEIWILLSIILLAFTLSPNHFDLVEIPVSGGISLPVLQSTYRLSRIHSAGDDYQRYNRIILFGQYGDQGNAKFLEGFGANEFIVEGNTGTYQLRKQTTAPIELYEFDKFEVIGDYRGTGPHLRSWLAITIVPFGLDVSNEHDVFNCRIRDWDASHGQEIKAYNSTELGTDTNVQFYDRDVRTVNGQRNLLEDRIRITPTPPKEGITEQILETL